MKKTVIQILLTLSMLSTQGIAAELSSYATQKIISAQKVAENGDYTSAINSLKTMKNLKSYDQAYVDRILGIYSWQAGNPKNAINYLSSAVNSHQLNDDNAWSTEKMLADLLLNEHQYKKSLIHYQNLLNSEQVKNQDELWLWVAQIHYQLSDWKPVLNAISKYEAFNKPDAVTPLTIKLGAELQLERFKSAITTVKRIIPLEQTNRNWWMQLVSLYLKTNQPKLALSSLELAHSNNVGLKQEDLILLAQLYAQNGIPERAARVLSQVREVDKDTRLIVQLASYWQNAREWEQARESWKVAATLNKKYLWNVAQIQIQQGSYQNAYRTLAKLDGNYPADKLALEKARIMYKLNKLGPALKLAKKAHELKPSNETKSWVKYLSQLKHYQNQTSGPDKLVSS